MLTIRRFPFLKPAAGRGPCATVRTPWSRHRRLAFCLVAFLLATACSGKRPVMVVGKSAPSKRVALPPPPSGKSAEFYEVHGQRYYPLSSAMGFTQTGIASWYGKKFHGNRTSSGEIYDMYKISAAHKTLPLGTYVSVTNLSNNKRVILKINDRGPFLKGRVIDLSYAAARKLGMVESGLAKVKIVALGKEVAPAGGKESSPTIVEIKDHENGEFTIQIGAFKDIENARLLARRLHILFDYVDITNHVDEKNQTFYRVYVSKSNTLTEAAKIEKRLEEMGFSKAFIVRM
jgi:rare lipoprotein A